MSDTAQRATPRLLRKPVFPSDFRTLFRCLARVAVASSFGVTAAACTRYELGDPSFDPDGVVDSGTPNGGNSGNSGNGGRGGTFGAAGTAGMAGTGFGGSAGFGVAGTIGMAGSGGGIFLHDAGSPLDGWQPIPCGTNGKPLYADSSTFWPPVDFAGHYWLTTQFTEEGEPIGDDGGLWPRVLMERVLLGSACSGASDYPACKASLSLAKPSPEKCDSVGNCQDHVVVVTRGDEVSFVEERAALVALLGGVIDTEHDAMIALAFAGYDLSCFVDGSPPTEGWRVRSTEIGYELQQFGTGCGAPAGATVYRVDPTGYTQFVSNTDLGGSTCEVGRRPEGLCPVPPTVVHHSELGAYFAGAAHLEAASVHAFDRFARELQALGAPEGMVADAWGAALEEIEHTRAVGAIALRFGGELSPPRVEATELRDAFAIALENAVEGCVRETYGALVACHQAQSALDPMVRGAMVQIAEDETRHSQLAWQVAMWLEPKLTAEQRLTVRAARYAAFAELRSTLAKDTLSPPARKLAGLPDAEVAMGLVDQLGTALSLQA